MGLIHRLPFVLSVSMAITIGLLSKMFNSSNQEAYTRMLLGMVAFFAIGLLIRYVIVEITEELNQKSKEEELQQKAEDSKSDQNLQDSNSKDNQPTLDLRADDNTADYLYDDGFSPLKVSEIIKNNISKA